MHELGYVEGRNYILEVRWSDNQVDRLPALARELMARKPDLAIASPVLAAQALQRESTTVPIVIASGAGAQRLGLIASLGRPGGNVTGIENQLDELAAKQVEFLKEIAPQARRVMTLSSGLGAAEPDVRQERLLREAEAAARLSHPNIVTLYDVGRSPQGPYLILELLRGGTLAQRLRQGRLPVREALRVAVEMAKGLAHAHSQGVVHRDVKPGNVFLCDDGQVKLLDLGMAHAFGHRTFAGGTPAYMAPEQWRGAPEDERTDVFAQGVVLFETLAGAVPFPDEAGARGAEKVGAVVAVHVIPRPHANVDHTLPLGRQSGDGKRKG